jgi:putative ABC transport system permease protein
MVPAVTRAIREVDPEQPIKDVLSMEDVLDTSLSQQRMSMLLLGGFAALALLLAAMGIYSVLAYAVRRRRREIGIRMALGARASDVLRMVLMAGLRCVAFGVVIGVAGAIAASRVLAKLAYGISTIDLPTFASVCALLAAIGLLASLIPAWRASGVDPIRVLRDE